MNKHVIKILLVVFCLCPLSFSQERFNEVTQPGPGDVKNTSKYLLREDSRNSSKKSSENTAPVKSVELYRYQVDLMQKNKVIKEESSFNIISSFRQNIRFGGFWDRYAIVNFKPDMFIKPFEFLSIYAVHNSSYFIPITAVKEHFKLMALQSAAILAIDNTIKHFMPAGKIIKSVTGFLLKNIVMNTMLGKIKSNGNDKIFEQGSYYCAVSIRF